MGATYSINEVFLVGQYSYSYDIQVSTTDNGSFVSVADGSEDWSIRPGTAKRTNRVSLASVSAKRVRVYFTGFTQPLTINPRVRMYEISINGPSTPTPPDQVQVEFTDAEGQPVTQLALNDDGWPALNAATGAAANPLNVTVTITNPEQYDTFTLSLHSADDSQRFYTDFDPSVIGCRTITNELFNNSNNLSFKQFTWECAGLEPTAPFNRQIVVHPSEAGSLIATVTLQNVTETITANASVEVPKASITPIVFLPGLGATNPPSYGGDPNKVIVSSDVAGTNYDLFYESLQRLGYEKDVTFFRFPYDWLVSTIKSATVLRGELDKWDDVAATRPWVANAGNPDAIEFDFVGHSTGNLVMRAYAQTDIPARDNIRKWVSVAGPLQGLARGYSGFEGLEPELGAIETGVPFLYPSGSRTWIAERAERVGYPIYKNIFGQPRLAPAVEYQFVHDPINGVTILPEFLPTYGSYLTNTDDISNQDISFPYGQLINPLLESDGEGITKDDIDARRVLAHVLPDVVIRSEVQAMQGKKYDPYTANPVLASVPEDFRTTYYGLNTPGKMAVLQQRIGAQNMCIVYGGTSADPAGDTVQGYISSVAATIRATLARW